MAPAPVAGARATVLVIPHWLPGPMQKEEEMPMRSLPGPAPGRSKLTPGKVVLAVALALAAVGSAQATTIDFDHTPDGTPMSAPGFFIDATHLTELYAPLGVHFSGPGPLDGGAIVDVTGSWGFDAHSGMNFLGFNRRPEAVMADGGNPIAPETIVFDDLMSDVSVLVSTSLTGKFQMAAFDAAGLSVDSDVLIAGHWTELRVSSPGGIREVVLDTLDYPWVWPNPVPTFVYDDLSFTPLASPAPEPSSLGLLGVGLVSLVAPIRRKRRVGQGGRNAVVSE
jgi:hypothetical protein